jgi:predicted pyridoxine 5'-phosphate oxidase superfamily flavin-nucleotide-binding protein
MAILTQDIKDLIETNRIAYVATVDKNGAPNVSPKSTFSIMDDQSFVFAEIMSTRNRQKQLKKTKIALYFYSPEKNVGCQIKGNAEMLNSGELFEEMSEALKYFDRKANFVVKVNVEEIYPWPPTR